MAETDIQKRILDLASRSYRNNQYTFTSFLSEAEYDEFIRITKQLPPCGYEVWGGYEEAERKMVRFGSLEEFGYEEPFPLRCIHVTPLMKKFAQDLSHRDFLGALMKLGMERTELGDILVREREAYLFATEQMAEVICRELTRVSHTSVMAQICDPPEEIMTPQTEEGILQAASLRIDGFVCKLCKLSRAAGAQLFVAGKVYVNGKCMENESYLLKEGDKVSVRGYGKFRFLRQGGTTRKGNKILEFERFV